MNFRTIANVAIVAVALFGLSSCGSESFGEPDVTAKAGMLKKLELKADIGKLVTPPAPTGEEGAEVLYGEAVKLAVDYGALFTEFTRKAENDPRSDERAKAILEKLHAAADKGLGSKKLKFDALPEITPYTEWGNWATLRALSELLSNDALARHMHDKNAAEADKSIRAGLIYAERLYKNGDDFVAYRSAGAYALSLSLGTAQTVWKSDAAKLAMADEVYKAFRKTGDPVAEKVQLILKDPNRINCADLWNMVEKDEDKAYQLEGLMWLGIARWTPSGSKYRSSIESYLTKKATSSDPLIAKYAAEGKKFPKSDVATLGNSLPH